MEIERNLKEELKELWNESKGRIKVGGFCLLFGAFYGFVKGMQAAEQINGKALLELINKIPELDAVDCVTVENF